MLEKKSVRVAYIEITKDMNETAMTNVSTLGGLNPEFPITMGLH